MHRFAFALILLLQAAGVTRQEGTISGRILSAEGSPASRIRVGAMMIPEAGTPDAGAAATAALTLTDDAGRYRLEGIPPGRYYVIAGFLDSPTYHPGVAGTVEAQVIEINAGVVVSNIDFPLKHSAGVRITGRVANIPAAVDRTTLRVILTGSASIGAIRPFPAVESTLSPDATFEFLRIPPGNFSVRLVSTANTILVQTPFGVADADVTGVELTVPPIVLGRVTVEDGSPLPIQNAALVAGMANPPAFVRFQVRALSNVMTQPLPSGMTSMAGRDGTFLLALPAGEYQFSPALLPIGYNIKSMTQGLSDLRQNPLKVTGNAVSEVHVTLTTAPEPGLKTVSVSGQITGLSGDTDISQLWMALQSTTTFQAAGTDRPTQRASDIPLRPDATFEFKNVPEGTYSLRLYPPDRFTATQTVTVSDQDVRGITLAAIQRPVPTVATGTLVSTVLANALPPPPPPPPPPSISSPLKRIQGRVLTVPGVDMPQNISLRSLQQPQASGRVVAVQRDGTFTFAGVTAGNYDVNVLDNPFPPGRNFSLTAQDPDVTGLEVKVPAAVRGRFTLPDGSPVQLSGAQLMVWYTAAAGTARNSNPMIARTYDVQPDGTFTVQVVLGDQTIGVSNLPAGYTLTSIQYGSTNVLNAPLRIDAPVTSEIRVVVRADGH